MADNLSQFRVRTRRYLKEMNPETSFWTETFLNQLFNGAYRRRSSQLVMAFEGWFVQIAVRDIEANKSTYGFPDGMQRLQKVELVRSDGRTTPVQRFERHDQTNPENASAAGDQYLPTYRPIGNGIVLEPEPIEEVSDGLRIEYAGLPAFLDSDSDQLNPSFPELFDELLVLDTVVLALAAEGIHESGGVSSILQLREAWNWDWERFIDQRTVARTRTDPFSGHYADS